MTGSASVTTLLLMLAAPGLAQDVTATTPAPAPAPTPAPRGVAGPPDGMIGPGPATRPPFVVPQPLPQPVTPAPTPAPSPAATTPSPASPDRAPPRRTETPRPRDAGDVAPAAPATGISPPLPDLGTGAPASGGSDILSSAPVDDTATSGGLPDVTDADWTLPAAIGGALLFLIGALLWWRGRSRKPVLRLTDQSEPEPAASPQPTPAPAAAPAPAPAPVPAPVPAPAKARAVTGRRADISIAFEPLAASSTLLNLRLRYAFHLTNRGNVDAVEVGLRIGMFSGNQASEAGVGQWLSMEGQAPHHAIGVIAPGETRMVEGELVAPLDALNALVLDGRSMAIPLIAADVRYSHPDSEALLFGQTGRAFVVGREPPAQGGTAAKLAPFRLDQGPTVYAPLGMRDTGIGRIA